MSEVQDQMLNEIIWTIWFDEKMRLNCTYFWNVCMYVCMYVVYFCNNGIYKML